MQAGSRQWWQAVVTCCTTGSRRLPPCSNPTSRHDSFSSRPFSAWHAATHDLQPEQASRSTSKAYCWPAAGAVAGISAE